MDIAIRQATSDDLNAIIQIQTEALQGLCSRDYTPPQMQALLTEQARWRQVQEVLFVAEHCGQLVGFAGVATHQPQITAVYVKPELARQGIGKQLLAAMEIIAIQQRQPLLWVLSSLTAVQFYQSQGYGHSRKTGFWSESGTWIPCVRLEKRLLPASFVEKYSIWIVLFVFAVLVMISLAITLMQ